MMILDLPFKVETRPHAPVPTIAWLFRWVLLSLECERTEGEWTEPIEGEESEPPQPQFIPQATSEWTSVNALANQDSFPGPSFSERFADLKTGGRLFRVQIQAKQFGKDVVHVAAEMDAQEFDSLAYCVTHMVKSGKEYTVIIGMRITDKDGTTYRFLRDGQTLIERKGV